MFSLFNSNVYSQSESFYDLNIKSIEGDNISFNSFKGKNVLIVNVASYCGFTRQYKALEQLYVKYKNDVTTLAAPLEYGVSTYNSNNLELKKFF